MARPWISNDYTGYAENVDEENSIEGQQGWFALSPDQARQVVVIDEVIRIVEIARAS